MENFFSNIDKQIESNQGKNLFLNRENSALHFIRETVLLCNKPDEIPGDSENVLIEYTINKVLDEFYRINQYFSFSRQDVDELRRLYKQLFSAIRSQSAPADELADAHYENLKNWLVRTNPFATKIYPDESEILNPVVCSEYSAAFQIDVLQINPEWLMSPVLDIGCGKQAALIGHLAENKNLQVCGIDRFPPAFPYVLEADWLAFDYGENKWGTIVSHLGFSNHFRHHHLRQDGQYLEYAKTFMRILSSLRTGGSFHYAPSLPFIEQYLDPQKFNITRSDKNSHGFDSVIIRRM